MDLQTRNTLEFIKYGGIHALFCHQADNTKKMQILKVSNVNFKRLIILNSKDPNTALTFPRLKSLLLTFRRLKALTFLIRKLQPLPHTITKILNCHISHRQNKNLWQRHLRLPNQFVKVWRMIPNGLNSKLKWSHLQLLPRHACP